MYPPVLPVELALAVDDAALEHLGDDVDDAAAANAHGLVGVADQGVAGLPGLRVDGHAVDGPVGGPHAAADVAALEGRAGGAGAAHQEFIVAEHQLAVGAQVDEQGHLLFIPQHRGERAGGDIATHVAADVRRQDQLRLGVQVDAQRGRADVVAVEECRDVGLHAHRLGVQAQQQVVHGGVACQGHAVYLVGVDVDGLAHLQHHRADGFHHDGVLQALTAALPARFDDAVDHVRAIADLTVSGHYHGGVVRSPFTGRALLSPYGYPFPKFGVGIKELSEDRYIIASAGLGDHSIPLRIFDPRELVVIRVTPKR